MRANSAEDYTICGSRLQREMITQKVAISYGIGASDLSIRSELSWGQTPTFWCWSKMILVRTKTSGDAQGDRDGGRP